MKKVLLMGIISLIFIPTIVFATSDIYVKGNINGDYIKEVLELVNEEREKVSLKPLVMDKNAFNAALQRSSEIAIYYSHVRPYMIDTSANITNSLKDIVRDYKVNYGLGENIAAGQISPKEVVNDWMNSESHRRNILNPKFEGIGIAVFINEDGTYYWVQIFTGKVNKKINVNEYSKSYVSNRKVKVLKQYINFNYSYYNKDGLILNNENDYPTNIKVTFYNTNIYLNETLITNNSIVWNSSNNKVFTVSSDGKITARGRGEAYLIASLDGISLKMKVVVKDTMKVIPVVKTTKENKSLKKVVSKKVTKVDKEVIKEEKVIIEDKKININLDDLNLKFSNIKVNKYVNNIKLDNFLDKIYLVLKRRYKYFI